MPADSLASFLDHASKLPNLTATEERELAARISRGDTRARDKLVEHNIRYAVKLARGWNGSGLSLEDLIQEAMVGLNIAADKFDPDKGRFTTYATKWIRKCLWDAAYGKSDVIKRPSRLTRTVSAALDHLSRDPHASIREIAEAIGRPPDEVTEALDHGRVVASVDDDGFQEVGTAEIEELGSVLDELELAEREAVAWRYGLYGKERSLEEVAEKMTDDPSVPGEYTQKDAARLCRAAVKRLRATRQTEDDEVICVVES